jgi:hypothetical protein
MWAPIHCPEWKQQKLLLDQENIGSPNQENEGTSSQENNRPDAKQEGSSSSDQEDELWWNPFPPEELGYSKK